MKVLKVPKLYGLNVCWDRDLALESPEKLEKPTCIMILLLETQSQVICYKILNRSSGTPSKLARMKLQK